MTTDCPKPYRTKLERICENGVCAQVDGQMLYVGNARLYGEKRIPCD